MLHVISSLSSPHRSSMIPTPFSTTARAPFDKGDFERIKDAVDALPGARDDVADMAHEAAAATDVQGMLHAELNILQRNPKTRNLPIETLIRMSKKAAMEKVRKKSAEVRKKVLTADHASKQANLMREEQEMSRRGMDPSDIHRKVIEKVTGTLVCAFVHIFKQALNTSTHTSK